MWFWPRWANGLASPYREGMEVETALEELERCAGSQFDPEVVAALVNLVRSGSLGVLALRKADHK